MIKKAFVVTFLCASCTCGISLMYVELERGRKGTVDCPVMEVEGYTADDTEATYWYFVPKHSSDTPKLIVSYFHGVTVHSSNNGQYDLKNSSLVISIVTHSTEGTYTYRYIPWYKPPLDGSVEVSEIVSRETRWSQFNECSRDQPSCELEVASNTTYYNLTCSVKNAKPAVNISWFRWSSCLNTWVEIHATHQFEPATCDASETDCYYIINTFNSNAKAHTLLESINTTFKCVTQNKKIGNFTVTVIKKDIVTGVTNPTEFGSYEPTSLMTTSEPLTCCVCPSLWIFFALGLLNVLVLVILMKLLCFYRTRVLYLETLAKKTKPQGYSAEENEVCEV